MKKKIIDNRRIILIGVFIIAVLSAVFFGFRLSSISKSSNLCSIDDLQTHSLLVMENYDETIPKKTAYLTFDDGPSKNTRKILDILKENDVTGTFFVITAKEQEQYFPLIEEIENEGHLVALHTSTHRYKNIYKNTEKFWADMKEEEEKLAPYISKIPKIMRFPGGSTNTVSRKYGGSSIMKILKEQAVEKGYVYFDWNVSAGDAGGSKISSERIFSNIIKDAKEKNSAIILLHDTKNTDETVKALPKIIKWLKENNFEIARLDSFNADKAQQSQ